ncbi:MULTISPECIES: TetR/AcrR family transcriptional regulator [unclassified Saccharothrix]|uniref:TetR/AcrR family transcriptional regulator n=1 Tax=unclassified Saccharothrix TaxID=2593673 RepID=UPI00307F1A21
MSIQQRRERERADRHRLIVAAARDLAETEGWEAVTTRRLAERVEYSQPVLYSHFKGKDAIVSAVAVDGCGDLAKTLTEARAAHPDNPAEALRAVAEAYLDFAKTCPALYDAMFVQRTNIPFGTPDSPQELKAAFGAFVAVVKPLAGQDDVETLTETLWSALHGLATLTGSTRLRPDHHNARLDLLLRRLLP